MVDLNPFDYVKSGADWLGGELDKINPLGINLGIGAVPRFIGNFVPGAAHIVNNDLGYLYGSLRGEDTSKQYRSLTQSRNALLHGLTDTSLDVTTGGGLAPWSSSEKNLIQGAYGYRPKSVYDYATNPGQGAGGALINDFGNVAAVAQGASAVLSKGTVGGIAADANAASTEAAAKAGSLDAGSAAHEQAMQAKAIEAAQAEGLAGDAAQARATDLVDQATRRARQLQIVAKFQHPAQSLFQDVVRPVGRALNEGAAAAGPEVTPPEQGVPAQGGVTPPTPKPDEVVVYHGDNPAETRGQGDQRWFSERQSYAAKQAGPDGHVYATTVPKDVWEALKSKVNAGEEGAPLGAARSQAAVEAGPVGGGAPAYDLGTTKLAAPPAAEAAPAPATAEIDAMTPAERMAILNKIKPTPEWAKAVAGKTPPGVRQVLQWFDTHATGREATAVNRENTRLIRMAAAKARLDPAVDGAVKLARETLVKGGMKPAEANIAVGMAMQTKAALGPIYDKIQGAVDAGTMSRDVADQILTKATGAQWHNIPPALDTPEVRATVSDLADKFAQAKQQQLAELKASGRHGERGLEEGVTTGSAPKLTAAQKSRAALVDTLHAKAAEADQVNAPLDRLQQQADLLAGRDRIGELGAKRQAALADQAQAAADFDRARAPLAMRDDATWGTAVDRIVQSTLQDGNTVFNPNANNLLTREGGTTFGVPATPDTALIVPLTGAAVVDAERLAKAVDEVAHRYQDLLRDPDTSISTSTTGREINVDIMQTAINGRPMTAKQAEIVSAMRGRVVWDMAAQQAHESSLSPFDAMAESATLPKIPKLATPTPPSPKTLLQQRRTNPTGAKLETPQQAATRGAREQVAIDKFSAAVRRQRDTEVAMKKAETTVARIQDMLTQPTPGEMMAEAIRGRADSVAGRLADQIANPGQSRVPPAYQPVWRAVNEIKAMVKKSPELEPILADLPKAYGDAVAAMDEAGFTPAHLSDWSTSKIRSLAYGTARLGPTDRGVGTEALATSRKARTGYMANQGLANRSIESMAAMIAEPAQEIRSNHVVDFTERNWTQPLAHGAEVPKGWTLWSPVKRGLLGIDTPAGAREAVGEQSIIPTEVARVFRRYSADGIDNPMIRALQRVQSPWKSLLLTWSPKFYLNHILGHVVLSALAGATHPTDWAKAWTVMRSGFKDLPEVTAQSLVQAELGSTAFVDYPGVRTAKETGGYREALTQVSRNLHHVVNTADSFARAAVVMADVRKGVPVETALQHAAEALVDYNDLNAIERTAVRAVIPFYGFQKGVLRLVARLPLDHPIAAGMMVKIGQLNEKWAVDANGNPLPSAYSGIFDVPGLGSLDTKPINPLKDAEGLVTPEGIMGSLHPIVKLMVQAAVGAPAVHVDNTGRIVANRGQTFHVGPTGAPVADINPGQELQSVFETTPQVSALGSAVGAGSNGGIGGVLSALLPSKNPVTVSAAANRRKGTVSAIPNYGPEQAAAAYQRFLAKGGSGSSQPASSAQQAILGGLATSPTSTAPASLTSTQSASGSFSASLPTRSGGGGSRIPHPRSTKKSRVSTKGRILQAAYSRRGGSFQMKGKKRQRSAFKPRARTKSTV